MVGTISALQGEEEEVKGEVVLGSSSDLHLTRDYNTSIAYVADKYSPSAMADVDSA